MKAMTRWDPFKELDDLQNRLATLFGRAPVRTNDTKDETMTIAEWAPIVDIIEEDNEYLIRAELPGLSKNDVNLSVHNGVLTIHGERRFEREEKGKRYHRVERAYGSFSRSFTLPDEAEADKVTAEFKDGMLSVHVPKSEKAKPKSIEVKIA